MVSQDSTTVTEASKETRQWDALKARALPAPEDFFVYAVRTTGVFCRPTCASRRPLRRNVEFFDRAVDALRRGYRPCKRCRPLGSEPKTAMLERACALLSNGGATRTRDVADALGVSTSFLQRTFKQHLGVTPQQYRRRVLAEAGRSALRASATVTESVYAAGYASSSRFYDGIGRELGMSPSAALRGGDGETIRHFESSCSLGRVLIAWTTRGVCEVALGDDGSALEAELRAHFPKARFERCDPPEWARAVVQAVEHGSTVDLPLDIRGTAFQERVWQALRTIPRGETRSYSELAEALGAGSASRAVAHACARNKLAVLVPCHRVLRRDGTMSGYRWGVERKRALLDRESNAVEKR
jgi:AraC family transcriptional regulator of adaptative response/methylated-DNA-[protein]-cysteine methyltransferase